MANDVTRTGRVIDTELVPYALHTRSSPQFRIVLSRYASFIDRETNGSRVCSVSESSLRLPPTFVSVDSGTGIAQNLVFLFFRDVDSAGYHWENSRAVSAE